MINENQVMIELKKIIRSLIKANGDKDLKKHIYIIKSTLFFISQVILIRKNFINLTNQDILNELSKEFNLNLNELLLDIESIKEYKDCKLLDRETKLKLINCINKMNKKSLIQLSLGELYDCFTTNNEKKLLGQVYTPKDIVKEMINNNIYSEDIIKNPYFRVIDPACGGGYFLIEAYDKIKKIIVENYDKIILLSETIHEELKENIDEFILRNNIWGTDIDEFAIYITRFSLMIKASTQSVNIFKLDTLLDSETYLKDNNFDLVISNPPYIGHKKIDKDYRIKLFNKYSEVYSDKGDISYCFFKKAYELLKEGGKLSFITSRYFLESLSGRDLRKFINNNFTINRVIDFYGENAFKGVGISPVILDCKKSKKEHSNIEIYKRKKNNLTNSFHENLEKNFIRFSIEQDKLSDKGWVLLSIKEMKLFNKIDGFGEKSLEELCVIKQGIITGYDKAFIINDEELRNNKYESDIIKPWIKNSDIDKYYLKEIKKYIIYTDSIDSESNYPNIMDRILKYKDKLTNRRECLKGIRKWYELQWGRDEELFKNRKIVFPYKSDGNKFTIVKDEVYSSADIYLIIIKEEHKKNISLEYLVAFLNSKVCEFYFKCIAKKLNDKLYEYYPNKLVNLKLKIEDDMSYIEDRVSIIEKCYKTNNHFNVQALISEIDDYFYRIYELDDEEICLIENY